MLVTPTRTLARRTIAGAGLSVAAVMASAFVLAPAIADDETPSDIAEPSATTAPPETSDVQEDAGGTKAGKGGQDDDEGGDTDTDTDKGDHAKPDESVQPAPDGGVASAPVVQPSASPTASTPPVAHKSAKQAHKRVKAADDIEPFFGYRKVRIGVKIADGSVVPDGTTTLGTKIRITVTAPNEQDVTSVCTTTVASADPADPTATFCDFDNDQPFADGVFVADPGRSVHITQLTVNANLIIDASTPSVGPCEPQDEQPSCDPVTLLLVDPVIAASDPAPVPAPTPTRTTRPRAEKSDHSHHHHHDSDDDDDDNDRSFPNTGW